MTEPKQLSPEASHEMRDKVHEALWALGVTLAEATAGADRIAELAQAMNVPLEPWRRLVLERYYTNRP